MTLKDWLKEWWFEVTHSPNSPEGLRHRANRLVEKGVSETNPMVTYLRKLAEMKENE